MKRASGKEPVGKKNSGLGKLMSVLHQNAASLVTTRTAHNGPDQVKKTGSLYMGKIIL